MPPRADLLPGTLDLLILKAVSLGSLNGYAIMERIEQMTGGALLVEQGALYPALYRLEHRGLLATEWGTSENNRRAKFYSLTAAGRHAAEDRARQLEPAGDGDGERPRDPRPRGVRWWPPACDRGCGACSRAAASSATWPTRWPSISQRAPSTGRGRACRGKRRRGAPAWSSAPSTRCKEDCRQARGLRWLDELRADLTYAGRALRASPLFTSVTVAILAIAIGANTAVFSVVEAVMLRRLPVLRPDQLRELAWIEPPDNTWKFRYDGSTQPLADGGRLMTSFAYPVYTQLRDRSTAFASLFLFATREVNLDAGGRARQASALAVSANFLDGLGTTPLIGRGIRPEDDRVDAPHVVVLSHRLWQADFGGDPRILGRTIRVNARAGGRRRRDPPGLRGHRSGSTVRSAAADRQLRRRARGTRPAGRRASLGLPRDGTAAPRRRRRPGPRRDGCPAARGAAFGFSPGDAGASAATRRQPRRPGPRPAAPDLRAAAVSAHGDDGRRAVHRLRQRGRPAAGAHRGPPARDGDAPGARRGTGPARAPAAHRECRPLRPGRVGRRRAGLHRPRQPASGAQPGRDADRAGPRHEPVGAGLLDRHVPDRRARVRAAPGPPRHARRRPARARPRGRGPRHRRAPALRRPDR